MEKIISLERISLKDNPNINEAMIQDYLSRNPEALGIGKLELRSRERIQPAGGRLDLLFSDELDESRYEVELQLGQTDPSHIIRTIEYWDLERKRFPQYEHCAVIVAEDITSRFMNVISLFNGNIPLIAIQLSAYKTSDGILLAFTKVLDRVIIEDDDDGLETTDRTYWEKKSTPKMMEVVDKVFDNLSNQVSGCELKYNKFYIGIQKNGIAKNFISFSPKKAFLYINARGQEDTGLVDALETAGVETVYRDHKYRIRLNNFEDYKNNKELINKIIDMSIERFGINE